jgi:DsbC/DsbD-like thiol-disulfide interchange protein
MASGRARWALLLLLALASAHVASAAWGKKAEPAAVKVKEAAKPAAAAAVADANAGLSHTDETGVNTYWRAPGPG